MNFPALNIAKENLGATLDRFSIPKFFPKKLRNPVNLLIWVIVVVSVAGFGYAIYLNSLPREDSTVQSGVSNPENTPIESWKNYVSTKYFYTLKYPPNWSSHCGGNPNSSDAERVCFIQEGEEGTKSQVVVNIRAKDVGLTSTDYVKDNVLSTSPNLKVLNDLKYFSTYDMVVVEGFESESNNGPRGFFVKNPVDAYVIEIVPESVSELTLRRIYSNFSFEGLSQTSGSSDDSEYSLEKLVKEEDSICPEEERYKDYQKALSDVESVCRLDLSERGIPTRKELPSSIGKFTNLKELVLVNNSLLVTLPQELGQLQNLVSLNLTNVPLKEFPSSVAALRKLKYLDWKGHDISRIPGNIDSMVSLVRLVLDGKPAAWGSYPDGKLKEVLNDLHSIKTLKHLDLSNNVVSFLPPLIREMKWLETLDLRNTDVPSQELERIKKSLSNTKVLF
ncbi:MAG: hypothetical protein A3F33_02825 [Candidatus Woykebacteria bacterium RIFCSPHIGHO2_12_FULL_43_10]|uniref:Disease resistance R13L4/SHOC-2-like LRR domain-containing protein n=2 Tax=Candidatus Woykeibacteriota TaxID=1817899 RepID=A0A1G1WXE9_9BACT|nr:MAG: hypothetical protein A2802_01450 [Candidatus Woykebacteria bacterium RIFCSPHIGHO2_01_FULL_43_29]OGY28682.1 MAG: hypothetical protein A3J50_01030 [Candidatus Woykebacteria bacterium RIFCSPHIGHO2_02_FULL_43_16b]OGY29758.1 MAG: hypothetical protein A3F33_02825 [Candidatus Woykebacteria bacterium RIFCSPHIGHO2_12_FULL_43_10]OGY32432.1 MAG: hypothetical protein A3A61_00555 [Candidatus Woykebacteria bacterium RIFCSPLOWO2_01_FULL_43_14]